LRGIGVRICRANHRCRSMSGARAGKKLAFMDAAQRKMPVSNRIAANPHGTRSGGSRDSNPARNAPEIAPTCDPNPKGCPSNRSIPSPIASLVSLTFLQRIAGKIQGVWFFKGLPARRFIPRVHNCIHPFNNVTLPTRHPQSNLGVPWGSLAHWSSATRRQNPPSSEQPKKRPPPGHEVPGAFISLRLF
jgi:hypothetical protein